MEVWVVSWSEDYNDCNAVCSSFVKGIDYVWEDAMRMQLKNFHPVDESPCKELWKIWEFDNNGKTGSVIIQKYTVDGYNIVD